MLACSVRCYLFMDIFISLLLFIDIIIIHNLSPSIFSHSSALHWYKVLVRALRAGVHLFLSHHFKLRTASVCSCVSRMNIHKAFPMNAGQIKVFVCDHSCKYWNVKYLLTPERDCLLSPTCSDVMLFYFMIRENVILLMLIGDVINAHKSIN